MLLNLDGQATIDAAAAKGNGAAAYFPPGLYKLNSTLIVKPGNWTLLGSGFQTKFEWSNEAAHADPAVIHVQGGGGGLRLEQFMVAGGQKDQAFDTKILHDGASDYSDSGELAERINSTASASKSATATATGVSSSATRLTTYDGVYTSSSAGGDVWNSTGFQVKGLQQGDTVHFVHLDGNLKIEDRYV
jgi:hypothetical protein